MTAFHAQVLAALAAVPVGQKLPLSGMARKLDCSVSVLGTAIEALIATGDVDKGTLRPVAKVQGPTAAPMKRQRQVPSMVSGAELVAEVQRFLDRAGMKPTAFCLRAIRDPGAWARWKGGAGVTDRTVAKVRAFIAQHDEPSSVDAAPAADVASQAAMRGDSTAGPASAQPAVGDAADDAGPADQDGPADVHPAITIALKVTNPTGQQLFDAIEARAEQLGMGRVQLAKALWRDPGTYFRQLLITAQPKPETVARVRALLTGETPPPQADPLTPPVMRLARAERAAMGLPPSEKEAEEARVRERAAEVRRAEEAARAAAETARDSKLPGETLAEAVKREAEQAGDQHRRARCNGGGVGAPVDLKAIPCSPKHRKVEPLPPALWSRLRDLAATREETPMELLPTVVEIGLDALAGQARA